MKIVVFITLNMILLLTAMVLAFYVGNSNLLAGTIFGTVMANFIWAAIIVSY